MCGKKTRQGKEHIHALEFYQEVLRIDSPLDLYLPECILSTIPSEKLLTPPQIYQLRYPLSPEDLEKALARCAVVSAP